MNIERYIIFIFFTDQLTTSFVYMSRTAFLFLKAHNAKSFLNCRKQSFPCFFVERENQEEKIAASRVNMVITVSGLFAEGLGGMFAVLTTPFHSRD